MTRVAEWRRLLIPRGRPRRRDARRDVIISAVSTVVVLGVLVVAGDVTGLARGQGVFLQP